MALLESQGGRRWQTGLSATLQSITSRLGILVINGLTGMLTARALGPAGRGDLAAMIIWSLFLASLTTLGLPSSVIFYMRRETGFQTELATTAVTLSGVAGTLIGCVGWFCLPYWLSKYSLHVIHAAQWFLFLTPICAMSLTGRAVLEAKEKFSASNVVQVLTPLATLTFLLIVVACGRLTTVSAAMCYILAALPTG